MIKKLTGTLLIIFGISLILTNISITGAIIGTSGVGGWLSIVGVLALALGGVLVGVSEERDLEEEESDLVHKLLIETGKPGKRKIIKFQDPFGAITQSTGNPPLAETAQITLRKLKDTFDSPELRPLPQAEFKEAGYFKMAYAQRDISPGITGETIGRYADEFLKEWCPEYRPFVPPTNPLLIYTPNHSRPQLN